MRLPGISEQQRIENVKQGMILQLLNGVQKGMVTGRGAKRAAQKAAKILTCNPAAEATNAQILEAPFKVVSFNFVSVRDAVGKICRWICNSSPQG